MVFSMKFQRIRINARRYGGTVLMLAGISLLASIALPPTCWLFAIAISMIIAGYSMIRKRCYYKKWN